MTADRLEYSTTRESRFSSRAPVRNPRFFLTLILLIALSSPLAVAEEELTLAQAMMRSDAPLFRLPHSEGVYSLNNSSIHQQEGDPAAESEAEGEEVEHRNELALVLAGTYESSEEENYFTIGAEYKYGFHPKVGIMGVIEYISGTDAWVLVVPVTFHPKGGLEILAGPGVELEPRRGGSDENGESEDDDETDGHEESGTDALFLFRIGVAYSFEFGERYSITPGLELDFVNEEDGVATALVYGLSFGIGF